MTPRLPLLASILAALVLAASAACPASAAEVARLEGRAVQPDGIALATFTATGAPAAELPCVRDGTQATGERYACGSGLPSYEILHTFGDPAGAAVMYFAQDAATRRAFFACRIEEQDGKLASLQCDRQPPLPPLKSNEELIAPIAGSVPGFTLANAHQVDADGHLFRSMAPKTQAEYAELKRFGIDTVVILRLERNGEVQAEKNKLSAEGIEAEQIPLDWKDYSSFQEPCELTITALKLLFKARAEGRKLLFHCTVGEDRTGYLAALFRLLTEKQDAKTLFAEEMCERGYDLGDASKPMQEVVLRLRAAVTVLYSQMVERIRRGQISADRLDAAVCRTEIPVSTLDPAQLTCPTSTRFRPPRRFSN